MADPQRAVESLAGQVNTLWAIGRDGLKLIEGKPMVRKLLHLPLEDPVYAGMWAALEARDFPLLLHLADPEEFWHPKRPHPWAHERGWFYGDGTYPQEEALYAEVAQTL